MSTMSRTSNSYWSIGLLLLSHSAIASFLDFTRFGNNPGALSAKLFKSSPSRPLVVLLHGCTQNGEDFAQKSGFLAQAERQNFNLLVPQQSLENNPHLCFNWYSASDYRKDSGESLSLKNMIMMAKARVDAKRVYIAGLSAGGAMTSIMLLNYPELFSGGAVIAGLPFPCADNLEQALSCMKNGPAPEALYAFHPQLKQAKEDWPKLTIWFGNQDKIVNPVNSQLLAQQWLSLTGAHPTTIASDTNPVSNGVSVRQWRSDNKGVQLQLVEIDQIGHGMPVAPGEEGGGESGPYLLKSPLSAAIAITKFWLLTG